MAVIDKENLIVRAVTLPVAEPVGSTWQEFREALRNVWADSTALANWAVTELAKADVIRKPSDKKLKPMPKGVYLYGLAKKRFFGWQAWEGCYASAQCVLRGVEKKYRKARFDLLWRGRASLPTYRYPYPYPVHNQNWIPVYVEGHSSKVAAVQFTLSGKDFCLRLKSGPEFGRQLAMFRQLVEGAKRGEASLYQKNGHVMVKLVGWFPKPAAKSGHTLLVRTDQEAFWICEREGRREWIVNADHVRRRVEAHRCWLQRIREDMKAERRSGGKPTGEREALDKRCRKQNDFLDSKTHEYSAHLVAFAVRQGAATIIYDDTCREYLESFPWSALRTKLGYKLEAAGIEFVHRDSPATTEETEPCPTLQQASEMVRMTGRLARRRAASASRKEGSPARANSNGSASRGRRT